MNRGRQFTSNPAPTSSVPPDTFHRVDNRREMVFRHVEGPRRNVDPANDRSAEAPGRLLETRPREPVVPVDRVHGQRRELGEGDVTPVNVQERK